MFMHVYTDQILTSKVELDNNIMVLLIFDISYRYSFLIINILQPHCFYFIFYFTLIVKGLSIAHG